MNLSDRPLIRLLTLCVLYVAQGIPYGFVVVTLAAYLAERGFDAGTIGALAAAGTLPWTFKWVWGPMIDRFGIPSMGRRRPWIILAQAGMILSIAAMALVPMEPVLKSFWLCIPGLGYAEIPYTEVSERSLAILGWMVFVHNIFNSLQDVSVDALAVDLLREEERGRVSGLMYGSKFIGTFIGGAVLSRVLTSEGLSGVFVWQIMILSGIMLLPLLLRERAGERLLPWTKGSIQLKPSEALSNSAMILFRRLGKAFSLKSTLIAGAIGLGMFIANGALGPVLQVFYQEDLGWKRTDYTDISGGWGVFMGLAGAMGGGFLADLFGAKRIIAIGSIGLGICYLGFAAMSPDEFGAGWFSWESRGAMTMFILAEGFLVSLASVGLFSMYMTVSWPIVAGTQFTAYMALLNLSTTTGQWMAGVVDNYGLVKVILAFGIFQLLLVLLLPLIDVHQTRRVLGDGTSAST
ncbi:MAG: MFS transporter [Phycisphaerales bacterium]|nr:MFS transporter [Phycisphaerales bacterium]